MTQHTNLVEELRWRGMIQDIMPETETQLQKEMTVGYVGFDPTAPSLHIGNLVPIILLMRLQKAGHKPIALVGGATGMIGDPSGKSEERNLLDLPTIRANEASIKQQLEKFLDFDCGATSAEVVNNYDWFKEFHFLDFLREAGKHLTISYMLAKDSVKNRMEKGISFTEFAYQLLQGYDFYHLFTTKNCRLQMGGSDQWGNITAGTELIRRKTAGDAFALTCPLLTKADGSKFGKSETGNVWLSAERTSAYKFYQFWLNVQDADLPKLLRFFTFFSKEEIEQWESEYLEKNPNMLKKILAEDLTLRVHSQEDLQKAQEASSLLFGKATWQDFENTEEQLLQEVFETIDSITLKPSELEQFANTIDILAHALQMSKGEVRRLIKNNGITINQQKVDAQNSENPITTFGTLKERYILIKKGKKYSVLQLEKI